MAILLRFTFLVFLILGCGESDKSSNEISKNNNNNLSATEKTYKINGVSFVASRDSLHQKNIQPLLNIHANFTAIMPFGFIKSLDHPQVVYNQERQWYGETMDGSKQYINLLHKNKIKVMMKPQIWVWGGEFTGLLTMASEDDWLELEDSYRNFILDYAKLAEKEKVEIFCIGTELEKFIEHRPEYWSLLITAVRAVYSGKITYAANWDEYKRVPFWDLLDYVGIDAYFPISDKKTPKIPDVHLAWKQWEMELKSFSEKENKQILFTEYGYRSVDFGGKEPWKSERKMNLVNLETQINLLEGLYGSIWKEDWIAGGFLWKWFIENEHAGGLQNNQFTPQNKPAETIIRKYYVQN